MMYKLFAGGTLVIAPMIVLALQNFAPHQVAPHNADVVAAPAVVAPVAPPVIVPAAPPAFVPPDLSQPMSDAGQPSIDPGANQPAASTYSAGGEPPPGSPNAEH